MEKSHLAGLWSLDPMYATKDAAAYLNRGVSTLARWRRINFGPAYSKIGVRDFGYRKSALDAFLSGGAVEPVEAAATHNAEVAA